MRTISIFIIAILACSCRPADSNLKSYDNIQKRYDEINEIMGKDKYHVIRGPLPIKQVEEEILEVFGHPKEDINNLSKYEGTLEGMNLEIIKKNYESGDEFYYFRSMQAIPLSHREGYIMVRGNKIINRIVTIMS